jgi:hypothetical protein
MHAILLSGVVMKMQVSLEITAAGSVPQGTWKRRASFLAEDFFFDTMDEIE